MEKSEVSARSEGYVQLNLFIAMLIRQQSYATPSYQCVDYKIIFNSYLIYLIPERVLFREMGGEDHGLPASYNTAQIWASCINI